MSDKGIYSPDYAVHPGLLLEQELEHHGFSQAEFARRIARTPKLVSEIIAGKNPVEPETALQFERVLGIGADIWLGLEAQYRLTLVRAAAEQQLATSEVWLSRFPVKELVDWKILRREGSVSERVSDLLRFFGVASQSAFEARYAQITVHYRRSKKLEASREALLSWLRVGEIQASEKRLPTYDKDAFRSKLREIRRLTDQRIEDFHPKITAMCEEAGVAFILVPPLPKTCLSGAAYWAKGTAPVIQQSLRHKTNDHFWFTFFHEAAHIVMHSHKAVYADDDIGSGGGLEDEANVFATDSLVGTRRFQRFLATEPRSALQVKEFAHAVDIHPGIVVGMLQHHGIVPWSHLNNLKVKFAWKN